MRWLNNLGLTAVNYGLLMAFAPLAYSELVQAFGLQDFGLLHRFPLHPVAAFVALLLAMELTQYWVHRASHRCKWLWRLHALHHSDTQLDFSTTHRHHPAEALMSVVPSVGVIVLLGPELQVLLAFNLAVVVLNTLSHANMSWGTGLNRALKWIVVTPDFHRLHHSAEERHTNSHYGTTLPIFDHLFGTATPLADAPSQEMPIGLEYLREPRDARLDRMLLQPFLIDRARRGAVVRAEDSAGTKKKKKSEQAANA